MPDNIVDADGNVDQAALDLLAAQAATAPALARELAFVKAGVDTSLPLNELIMKNYTGELTAEKIAAAMEGYGVQPNASIADQAAANAAAAAIDPNAGDPQQAFREGAALGGVAAGAVVPPPPADPRLAAWEEFNSAGGSLEARQLTIVDKFISGAAEGDTAFLFDQDRWTAERDSIGNDFRPRHLQGTPVA